MKTGEEFHKQALEDGFVFYPIHMWKRELTLQEVIETQDNVDFLDTLANTAKRKPFVRLMKYNADTGEFRGLGGGLLLYIAVTPTKDARTFENKNEKVRGTMPLFARIRNPSRFTQGNPVFSVQMDSVVGFYAKPQDVAGPASGQQMSDDQVLQAAKAIIKKVG